LDWQKDFDGDALGRRLDRQTTGRSKDPLRETHRESSFNTGRRTSLMTAGRRELDRQKDR
jgi:hypothetical protein